MNIELNKTYRTRSGLKYRIICVDRMGSYPIIGLTPCGSIENLMSWTKEGKEADNSILDNPYDLISEWVDKPTIDWSVLPRWHKYAAMDESMRWYSYNALPICTTYTWERTAGHKLNIPPEYAPKWKGDWKDSLISRDDSIVQP
jgi:hypothetical protein